LALTDKGQVEFIGAKKTDGTFQTYAEFLQTEDGKKMTSAPFGVLGRVSTCRFATKHERSIGTAHEAQAS
jgi:hypothetical protein